MSYQQLSQQERYTMTAFLKTGLSRSAVARIMGRHKSTISRELRRNLRPAGHYAASVAHSMQPLGVKEPGEVLTLLKNNGVLF